MTGRKKEIVKMEDVRIPLPLAMMRHSYSSMEQKIFIAIVSKLYAWFPENGSAKGNDPFSFEIKAEEFNVPHYAHPELRKAVYTFMSKPVYLPSLTHSGMVEDWIPFDCFCATSISTDDKKMTSVRLSFTPAMYSFLMDSTKQKHVSFPKYIVFNSRSLYTPRFYMFALVCHLRRQYSFELHEIRDYLCLSGKYRSFRQFKSSVLEVVSRDISQQFDLGLSDISFSFAQEQPQDKESYCPDSLCINMKIRFSHEPNDSSGAETKDKVMAYLKDFLSLPETSAKDMYKGLSMKNMLIPFCKMAEIDYSPVPVQYVKN